MRAALLALGLVAACAPQPAEGTGGQPQPLPAPVVVARGETRHFPFAFEAAGQALVSYSQHVDDYVLDPVDAMAAVVGAGAVASTVEAANFYISGVAAVGAALYGVSYITSAIDSTTERSHGWRSLDSGRTWHPRPGLLHLPQAPKARPAGWGGLLFHRRLHRSGTSIVGTAYGNYDSDGAWYRTVWVSSPDEGGNWNILSTVAAGAAGTEGYGEPVSVFCPDGQILIVMRTGPDSPMRMTRSGDRGLTWEPPSELGGRRGWDPDLMPDGRFILLSYGLPGRIWVAATPDCGSSWREVYQREIPTTSGYTGLAHLGGQVMVFTDSDNESTIIGYPIPDLAGLP